MNDLLGRRITGRKIGEIIGFKDAGQFKSLIIKREDKPTVFSIRLSKGEVEKLKSGEKVAGIRLLNRKTAGMGRADSKPKYKAILFTVDGGWVTDFPGETKDEVESKLADRGSLWYFYPIEGLMRYTGSSTSPGEKVIKMYPPFDFLSGKTIREISKWLEENQDDVADFFNSLHSSSSRIKRTAGRIGADDRIPSFGELTPTNMVMSEPVTTYPPALAAEDVVRVMRYMKGSMDANSAYEFVIQHVPYVTSHYEEEVKAELKRMGVFIK